MEPTTLRLPADLAEALAAEAEEYGYGSRAEYVRRILRNRPEGDPATADTGPGDEPTLAERVDELERRLAAVEDERADGGDESADPSPAGHEETFDPDVWAAVESVAEEWTDPPERLAARKAAAAAVLGYAVRSGEAVGRGTALERFHEEYPVEGQYRGAWWRNTVRPVLRAVGEYVPGAGGYRVDSVGR
jgi:Arc/MetJ-type ribon-helix-helix transcriptional regulator